MSLLVAITIVLVGCVVGWVATGYFLERTK